MPFNCYCYGPYTRELNRLRNIREVRARRKEYIKIYKRWSRMCKLNDERSMKVLRLINNFELFPGNEDKIYFFKYAVKKCKLKMIHLVPTVQFDVHKVRFKNGKSALHYLAGMYEIFNPTGSFEMETDATKIFHCLLMGGTPKKYRDAHGYTYFHGACTAGDEKMVNKFLGRGVDVNLDTYTCSPLYIAAWYRREAVVEILLKHGAEPNQRDHVEQATPLHALAWSHYRPEVDNLVKMLVDNGADIEARNRHGDTPLHLAMSRFDAQLARALLKHGASLSNLNESRMFSSDYSPPELNFYPVTWSIIETMDLLRSAGYKMDFLSKFRIMKCWIKVRQKYDVEHMIAEDTGNDSIDRLIFTWITSIANIYRLFGFYIKQDAMDYLNQRQKKIRSRLPVYIPDITQPCSLLIDALMEEVDPIKDIRITKDVSLFQLCKMSYSEGYSLIKNLKNWSVPALDSVASPRLKLMVKRHLANILIRPQLVLLAADLFMTNHCKLNLPYIPCRRIAEYMSDEELLRLIEQTNEKDLKRPLPARPTSGYEQRRCV